MPTLAAHPERATLLEFAAGQLDDAGTSAVERHLRRCTACRALVASAPAPEPSAEDAAAAADELLTTVGTAPVDATVVTEPIGTGAPIAVQPAPAKDRPRMRSAIRTRRLVAAILAILIIILLAVTAWFVTTDDWRNSSENSSSDSASRSVRFDTQPF